MSTQQRLPDAHPMLIAFKAWFASEEGQNALRWSAYQNHMEGVLWRAFLAGWQLATPIPAGGEG